MAKAEELGVDDVFTVVTTIFGLEGDIHKKEFRFLCPVHTDTNPSAGVNLVTGYWNCWSCKGGGDLVDLGAVVLKRKRREVRKLLSPTDPEGRKTAIQSRLRGRRKAASTKAAIQSRFKPYVPSPDEYRDGPLEYLVSRGFKLSTLRSYQVRFVKKDELPRLDDKPLTITNAVGIPIFSETGEPVAWCYRATPNSDFWFQKARYIYTPEAYDIAKVWFGMNRYGPEVRDVLVTEGALDAMWCDQCGFPAVALLGSHAKQTEKIRKLMRYRRVTLIPDRDRAGEESALALGEALTARGVPTMVGRYASFMTSRNGERAKDAQDLSPVDLELVVARAVPFTLWRRAVEGGGHIRGGNLGSSTRSPG